MNAMKPQYFTVASVGVYSEQEWVITLIGASGSSAHIYLSRTESLPYLGDRYILLPETAVENLEHLGPMSDVVTRAIGSACVAAESSPVATGAGEVKPAPEPCGAQLTDDETGDVMHCKLLKGHPDTKPHECGDWEWWSDGTDAWH
jgi:hypothetical protein